MTCEHTTIAQTLDNPPSRRWCTLCGKDMGSNELKNKCRQKIDDMLDEVLNDVQKVFAFGHQKHPDSGDEPNFLLPDGNKCSLRERGSSILRHAAQCFKDVGAIDSESNLPHILHLISSACILYIRHKRNIVHSEDL